MLTRRRHTIFIGNPGVGKSTLLNAAIGKPVFKSGLSIGTGLTTEMKMVEVNDGEYWGDTPGLDDIKTRQEAGKQIAKALRHGDGEYRLIFVVTQEALRIRPSDLTTMTLVLDAIKTETNQEHTFGVIVNKIEPEAKEMIEKSEETLAAFTRMLQPKGYAAPKVLLYPKVTQLIAAFDAVHDLPQDFYDFLEDVRPIYISPPQVDDVKYEDFDKLLMEYDELLEEKEKRQKLLKDIGYRTAATLSGVAVATGTAAIATGAGGGIIGLAFVGTGVAGAMGLAYASAGLSKSGEGNHDNSGTLHRNNAGDTNGDEEEFFGDKKGNQNNDDDNDHEKLQDKAYRVGGFDLHFLQASPLAYVPGPGQPLPIRRLDLERERRKFNETAKDTGIGVTYKIATSKQFRACLTSPGVHLLHLSSHGSAPNQQDQIPPLLFLESDGWGMVHPHGPKDISNYLRGSQEPQTVKFVFVSTGHSRSIGDTLVACGIPHVICCRTDDVMLHEATAGIFQNSFYRALACGLTVLEAFDRAKRDTVSSGIMEEGFLNCEVDKYCLLPEDNEHSYKPSEARWEVESSISSTVLDEADLKCPPTRVDFFRGREVEQCRILQILRDHRIVRVEGERGIGKKATVRAVCEHVRMRYDILDIDTIMWFGHSFISPDDTLKDPFSLLCERTTPDVDTRKATEFIIKHAANKKVLFIIESEYHNTMKQFLNDLKKNTPDHRAILIEPGKAMDNDQVDASTVREGEIHKFVTIRELDVESSVKLYCDWKYTELEGRDSFFEGIKAVYNRKPILQGVILESIGGQNPKQIIEAAASGGTITYQNLKLLWELTGDNFGFDWDVRCRTELEHLLENIEKVRKNAIKFENQNMAASLQWARHELKKQRTHFPKFDDLIKSYQEMKEQRGQAKERLMDAFEGRGQQEHLDLHRQDLELQSLADKLVAEAKAQVIDKQNFHLQFPTVDELDTQLRAAVLSAYSQCNDLLGEQINREFERIERAEIRFACLKELHGLESRLLSVEEKAEKRRDDESVHKLNDLRRRVRNSKEAPTGLLLALTTALPFFVNNLISRTENHWAANPISEIEQEEIVQKDDNASADVPEEGVSSVCTEDSFMPALSSLSPLPPPSSGAEKETSPVTSF